MARIVKGALLQATWTVITSYSIHYTKLYEVAIITTNAGDDDIENPDIPLSKGFTKILREGKLVDIEEIDKIEKSDEIVVDRLRVNKENGTRFIDSTDTAFTQDALINIHISGDGVLKFTKELRCPKCSMHFTEPTPQMFSFNSPAGACRECSGFGNILGLDPDLVVPDPDKSLYEGAIEPFTKPSLSYNFV